MTAALGFQLDIRPIHAMHPSPDLVTYAQLLMLGSQELEERVETELDENPALVRSDTWQCARCGTDRGIDGCGTCETPAPPSTLAGTWTEPASRTSDGTVAPDLAETPTTAARLIEEARPLLPVEDRWLVEWLVESLDDDGFLRVPIETLAVTAGVSVERLERARAALRVAGPASTGARDLRESLLLQLERLEGIGMAKFATLIVRDHLELLGRGHFARIAAALDVERDEIIEALDFIRRYLEPRPLPALHQPPTTSAPTARPDVIVRRSDDDPARLLVEVVRPGKAAVEVDPLYVVASRAAVPSERATLLEQVQRATSFVARLRDRERTLDRVARLVVERQWAFVRFGPQFVQPLTRAEVADALDVHESTVSRAVAHKFVQLPSGLVVSFADFFDTTLAVQAVLRDVLEAESDPLSDADLVASLRARGYRLARRTVAKYRQRLGVSRSTIRDVRASRA